MSSAGPGRREVAHRIFAAEYDDATLEYAESDEERAPNYVVLPSGARVNRTFVVGVLTAVEQVNEDTVRARIADPTGAFVVYAGQYQPDELAALQSMESPAFVAVTGKANTFSPEGSDRVLTSVRPESVTEVDGETRDRWVVATAEHTLARVQTAAEALDREERGDELRAALVRDGVEPGLAEGIAKALDHYDTAADYLGALRDLAIQALEVVTGDRSEVDSLERSPGDGDGTVSASALTDLLDEERQGVARAAGDVDPEALLGDESSDDEATAAEESGAGAESSSGASETAESAAEGATEATSDEEAEPTSKEAEPVTSEAAVERTAKDAEEAAEGDGGPAEETQEETDAPGAEPETSEEAVQETAADAEAAADAREGTDDEGAELTDRADQADQAEEAEEAEEGEAEAEEAEEGEAEAGEGGEESEADDELYEVDEAEREQIEEEHGVEFQSGTEVEPAGEAGIETEETPPEDVEEAEAASEDEVAGTTADSEEALDGADEEGTDDGSESPEDVDLESVLLDEMAALDDGDGADREDLVDTVSAETGADAETIDDAIDDLLMSGQCYEPSEGTLKPI